MTDLELWIALTPWVITFLYVGVLGLLCWVAWAERTTDTEEETDEV